MEYPPADWYSEASAHLSESFLSYLVLDPQHKNVAARFQTKQMVKDNGIVCVKNNIILHNGIQKRLLHGKPVGIDFLRSC